MSRRTSSCGAGSHVLFKALACDFDGTLALEDRVDPGVKAALEQARAADVRLILVTGRTFFELTRVCDCLGLFDAVVAENGAVIYYPGSAMIQDLGPAVPLRLLAELDRRGLYYQVGRVIVGTARGDEAAVRESLAAAAVIRDLVANRAALMLLPPGVSKGSGVEQVLRFLELSPHDVLALGDAENDLALFDACGFSACPGNSVAPVRERADWVLPGGAGPDVGKAIRETILAGRLPMPHSARHRIALGWGGATSATVTIPARAVNVLVHGDTHSGKSWLAGSLAERLVSARYAVCVIDPEGDYRVLSRLPGVSWTVVETAADVERALDGLQHDPSASSVLDLAMLPHGEKVVMVEGTLRRIRDMRRQTGRPHWVFLDEAHYLLHEGGVGDDVLALGDRGFCVVTYRPRWLRPTVVTAIDVWMFARTTDKDELAYLQAVLSAHPDAGTISETLPRLRRGQFLLVDHDPDSGSRATTFIAAPRQTVHVRHLNKYVDSVVPPGREFLFRDSHGRVLASANSLQSFRAVVRTVPGGVLTHHSRRGDFARWVRDVFRDAELARQIGKAEVRFTRGELADLREMLDTLITTRYGDGG
jgi:hydroxymethylpyrimidine pyrophosphatase-like HAD family hydrolase